MWYDYSCAGGIDYYSLHSDTILSDYSDPSEPLWGDNTTTRDPMFSEDLCFGCTPDLNKR